MRILSVHNYYQQAGGEDAVVANEQELLAAYGHELLSFTVSNHDITGAYSKLRAAISAPYSFTARRRFQFELLQCNVDVVHVHNFFPLLTPSIFMACSDVGVPVVLTLHNYRLACPNGLLFRDNQVCEDCVGKIAPWPGIVHGCYRGSRAQTAVVAGMIALHRGLGTWHKHVDAYIALTDFQKGKLESVGLPAEKIHVKPNFVVDRQSGRAAEAGAFALYVGRVSPEKGIETLVSAYLEARPKVPLKIVGDGPLRASLQRKISSAGLDGWVEFMGWQSPSQVRELMSMARFLVLPSVWYEGFPMTVVEAYAQGLPVIASRIGALPEIIRENETGCLVTPGDSSAWVATILDAWNDPARSLRWGLNARARYETCYSPDANYHQLMVVYQAVVGGNKSAQSTRS